MIVLDTNIVIGYIDDDAAITHFIDTQRDQKNQFCISSITATELLAFPKLQLHDRQLIEGWIQQNVFVGNIDLPVALVAADIRRTTKLKIADAIIAATALRMRVPLATRDRDFDRVAGLQIICP